MPNKIDDLIREALEGRDRALLGETEELGYFALGLKQFGGKLGWVTWVIMIVQALFFIAGVWCFVEFYQTSELMPALKWGLSGAVALIFSLQLKLSLAPQMQADRVIRQLKRIELLLIGQKD